MLSMQEFLGSQVRTFRNAQKLSQIELADRIGVSKETIGKIERGQAAPSFKTIDKICQELGRPPSSLFQKDKYARHQAASTALENLISKASKLDDNEVNWLLELMKTIESKP